MIGFAPLTIRSDTLEVTVLPFGASLVGVRFAGQPRNHVLGFADPQDHARVQVCAGGLAGPVANRVRMGRVEIAGTHWQMPQNEGTTCLHSGPDGLHRQTWDVADQGAAFATLACHLPHGTNGLPGNRDIRATYAVMGSTLRISLEATSDHTTPMNIAAHPYWNLDGHRDVSGHQIKVAAESYLPVDSRNLPLGAPAPVADTPFDFRASATVPLHPALDVNFCLASHPRNAPAFAARLSGDDGTTLDIATTAPGLQVYNGTHLPAEAAETQDAPPIAPHSGIALEPQHWPDALHHAQYPSVLLHPGARYSQITDYTLTPGTK